MIYVIWMLVSAALFSKCALSEKYEGWAFPFGLSMFIAGFYWFLDLLGAL
jgi:hypothetical protein